MNSLAVPFIWTLYAQRTPTPPTSATHGDHNVDTRHACTVLLCVVSASSDDDEIIVMWRHRALIEKFS